MGEDLDVRETQAAILCIGNNTCLSGATYIYRRPRAWKHVVCDVDGWSLRRSIHERLTTVELNWIDIGDGGY